MKYSIISRLKEQTDKSDIDLWLMLDEQKPFRGYEYNLSNFNIFKFSYDNFKNEHKYELLEDYYVGKYSGNCIYPLLYFYMSHDYDYYMFYEDDLAYTGDIVDLYDRIIDGEHDAYFSNEFEYASSKWYWVMPKFVPQLKYPAINRDNWRKLVLNIYILNKKALNVLDEALNSGEWCGHHEFLVPTILYNNDDISIDYFQDKLDDDITTWDKDYLKKYLIENDPKTNSLYHPIKDLSQLAKIEFCTQDV